MSGGSFYYNCFNISQFAEELQNRIDENDMECDGCYAPHYKQETLDYLKESLKIISLAAALAHDIEWLYSADICEETFIKRYKETIKIQKG